MNKQLLYVAVFAVVCAIMAQQSEAKAALKKRTLLADKINMDHVKEKVQAAMDHRKKRAAETPADKIRNKRNIDLSKYDIPSAMKKSIPAIQNAQNKLTANRQKREAINSDVAKFAKTMAKAQNVFKKANRKTRSAKKAPTFSKPFLNKIAKQVKRFTKN